MFENSMKRHSNNTHINETEYSKQYDATGLWPLLFCKQLITMKLAVSASLWKLFFEAISRLLAWNHALNKYEEF